MLLVMESVGVAFCNRGGWDGWDGVGGVGGVGEGEGGGGGGVGGRWGCGFIFSFLGCALTGIGGVG